MAVQAPSIISLETLEVVLEFLRLMPRPAANIAAEALLKGVTEKLVDKAIDAERAGYGGHIVGEIAGTNREYLKDHQEEYSQWIRTDIIDNALFWKSEGGSR